MAGHGGGNLNGNRSRRDCGKPQPFPMSPTCAGDAGKGCFWGNIKRDKGDGYYTIWLYPCIQHGPERGPAAHSDCRQGCTGQKRLYG